MPIPKNKSSQSHNKLSNNLSHKLSHKLEVVYVKASLLSPNSYNPNVQSPGDFLLLVKSILSDGMTQPVIVNLSTNEIVDGEHRWRAWVVANYLSNAATSPATHPTLDEGVVDSLRREVTSLLSPSNHTGATQQDLLIPVVYVEMTPEQMRVATLRHNRTRGREDQDLLSQVYKELDELGSIEWAVGELMLGESEINRLMQECNNLSESSDNRKHTSDPSSPTQHKDNSVYSQDESRDSNRSFSDEANKRKSLFTLHLVYAGEEADEIREVLGDQSAAAKVLEWCREYGTHS